MKNDRRISKSTKALKNALITLMGEKDFKKISITDLVQSADLNRGTFYKHYETKEDLLNELIDDVMEDLVHSYREPYLHTDTFTIEELTTSTVKIFEHVESYSKFYTIIINSNVLPGFHNRICNVLKQLAQSDLEVEIRPNERINAELLASYNAYAIFGLIVEWVNGGFKYTPAYMAEQLIEILSNRTNKMTIKTSMMGTGRFPLDGIFEGKNM
ncbi:TetR/AcrR family transcriptional regulator [Heyndrickxia vini]|uniref:TetR/AcrR family transcriptional regulator C-terminal domain-containing protein n=1 Tax=Heyndrickxia vini TaxID=1476025 RepID=A0ABX7E2B3_9BACI|nr:TetR/AcrR family transcriptional regulator [Heyndrickxia vini]QQZ09858.1 TetR/AcrR family transcriptional regulator C-terminal domain-containing protein [Heyndrickxia vini]